LYVLLNARIARHENLFEIGISPHQFFCIRYLQHGKPFIYGPSVNVAKLTVFETVLVHDLAPALFFIPARWDTVYETEWNVAHRVGR
jgi:hypothetical protein